MDSETITFLALEEWDYPQFRRLTYDYISDDDIRRLETDPSFESVDVAKGWEHSSGNTSTLQDNPVHTGRIASLVRLFRAGANCKPVQIEATESAYANCGYCVTGGHHRLRALQYLRIESFKATLSGDESALDQLRERVRASAHARGQSS